MIPALLLKADIKLKKIGKKNRIATTMVTIKSAICPTLLRVCIVILELHLPLLENFHLEDCNDQYD